MALPDSPDVIAYVCSNSVPNGGRLPRRWTVGGARVLVREVPCSGKNDGQYLLRALEGGVRGLCVVTCPEGKCRFTQGNYRAEIRVETIRCILAEIGLEPDRVELVRCSPDDSFEQFEQAVRGTVERICALGESPVGQV